MQWNGMEIDEKVPDRKSTTEWSLFQKWLIENNLINEFFLKYCEPKWILQRDQEQFQTKIENNNDEYCKKVSENGRQIVFQHKGNRNSNETGTHCVGVLRAFDIDK